MDYHALPGISLPASTDLIHVEQRPQRPLSLKSPAIEVLTDLRIIDPISIHDDAALEEAHARMVNHGIRLLFVSNNAGAFTGLLTASDVLGERPLRCMQGSGKQRKELLVADVMTPRNQLEALNMGDVLHASVGHIVATLKEQGRQHALVVERNSSSGHLEVCGLFSTSTIARRLGISLNFLRVPRAFSEIEHALLHES
ncbi:CBS domain-containing protein [Vogesella facilis]|uniref:CBS domain-containing protein n=1 Tax=Vogesella facilis TaxID=1655232 RepID=A0ABV7RD25_9NEIS